MFKIRTVFICLGIFLLSTWVYKLVASPISKLTDGVVYDHGIPSALAMGVMSSLPRAFAAGIAGALVAVVIGGRRPWTWASIVCFLYVVDIPLRHHWGYPATAWDRLWQSVDLLFPVIVCVAAVVLVSRFRNQRGIE
jgi:hypothetical protein